MRWTILLLGAVLVGVSGCDEPPRYEVPPAPEEVETEAGQEPPARPTAEELEAGEWTPLPLGSLPLTADVPQGWRIARLGEVVFLEGQMPSADVQIQLASRPPLTGEQLELLVEGAQRERQADPTVVHVELREQHGLQVLERRSRASLPARPRPDDDEVEAEPVELMNWRINFLVPVAQDRFDNHELNFLALRHEHYRADRELLERIVRSVRRE